MSGTTTTSSRFASWTGLVSGILRILVGFTFFWAFIDKLFGLGFATPSERAWINGGSPTTGYLTMAFVVLLLFAVRASDHLGFGRQWTRLVGEKSILR